MAFSMVTIAAVLIAETKLYMNVLSPDVLDQMPPAISHVEGELMKRTAFAFIAAAFLTTLTAAAQTDQPEGRHRRDPAKMFSRVDTNADGKVSLEEFVSARKGKGGNASATSRDEKRSAGFKKLDANADGYVTAEEFQVHAGKRGHKRSQTPQQ